MKQHIYKDPASYHSRSLDISHWMELHHVAATILISWDILAVIKY